MNRIIGAIFLLFPCGCSASGLAGECDYLLWTVSPNNRSESVLTETMPVSIFEILSRSIEESSLISVQGRIFHRQNVPYLIPAGSPLYAQSFSDRIRMRFVESSRAPAQSAIRTDSIHLVAGRLQEEDKQWVLETIYVRELRDMPDYCAYEGG